MIEKWQKNDRDKGQDQNKKQQKNDKKMTEKWQGQMTGQKKRQKQMTKKWQCKRQNNYFHVPQCVAASAF